MVQCCIAGNLTVTGTTEGDSNITLGDSATDTVTFGGTISGNLVFEGSTDDSFETTVARVTAQVQILH